MQAEQPPLYPPKPVQTAREFARARLVGFGARQLAREERRRRVNGHVRRRARAARAEQARLILE